MNARSILITTAAVLGALGLCALFLADVVASLFGLPAAAALPIQLFASGLLSLAALNWFGRGAIYGGIYGRPIVLANFAFAVITAGSLWSAVLDGFGGVSTVALAVWFTAQAVTFWLLTRRHPSAPDG